MTTTKFIKRMYFQIIIIKMKILFIAPKYTGGIGGHAAMVAEKLREYGFDIKLMHTSHIPIKKLKNPSFAVLSSLKAIIGGDELSLIHI